MDAWSIVFIFGITGLSFLIRYIVDKICLKRKIARWEKFYRMITELQQDYKLG